MGDASCPASLRRSDTRISTHASSLLCLLPCPIEDDPRTGVGKSPPELSLAVFVSKSRLGSYSEATLESPFLLDDPTSLKRPNAELDLSFDGVAGAPEELPSLEDVLRNVGLADNDNEMGADGNGLPAGGLAIRVSDTVWLRVVLDTLLAPKLTILVLEPVARSIASKSASLGSGCRPLLVAATDFRPFLLIGVVKYEVFAAFFGCCGLTICSRYSSGICSSNKTHCDEVRWSKSGVKSSDDGEGAASNSTWRTGMCLSAPTTRHFGQT